MTRETDASRIELGNLIREAQRQLEAAGFDKRRMAALMEQLQDLVDDDDFWRLQANSVEPPWLAELELRLDGLIVWGASDS